jgi:hypothetical protein
VSAQWVETCFAGLAFCSEKHPAHLLADYFMADPARVRKLSKLVNPAGRMRTLIKYGLITF